MKQIQFTAYFSNLLSYKSFVYVEDDNCISLFIEKSIKDHLVSKGFDLKYLESIEFKKP